MIALVMVLLPAVLAFGAVRAVAAPEFPKPTGYVNDLAGVLDPGGQGRLERLLARIDRELEVQLAVAIVPELDGYDVSDYASRLFEAWHVGNQKTNRGLLLVDAIAERKVWVEVGYGLEGVLPDGKVGAILDRSVIPLLKEGRRDLAYASAARALIRPVLEEMGRSPDSVDSLLAGDGFQSTSPRRGSRGGLPLPLLFIIIAVILSLFRSRRGRRNSWWIGGMPGGGFGGFGSFGGGGGGFGGFGGGSSGGGGAGRGY